MPITALAVVLIVVKSLRSTALWTVLFLNVLSLAVLTVLDLEYVIKMDD